MNNKLMNDALLGDMATTNDSLSKITASKIEEAKKLVEDSQRYQMFTPNRIYTDPSMLEPDGYQEVKLTWLERLKSLKPWIKYKKVSVCKPMLDVYMTQYGIVCHPAVAKDIERLCCEQSQD